VVRFSREQGGDIKKLVGAHAQWRLRVGDWRIVYTHDASTGKYEVIGVSNRRDAYDD
jgi:mRNA interferase RelE/StbE